jgi:hypothetical protein
MGKDKIVHYLINAKSNTCTHIIAVFRDRENETLIEEKYRILNSAMHITRENRNFHVDFICTDDMKNPNGKYNGLLFVDELLTGFDLASYKSHQYDENYDENLRRAAEFIENGDCLSAYNLINHYLTVINEFNPFALLMKADCLYRNSNGDISSSEIKNIVTKILTIEPHSTTIYNKCLYCALMINDKYLYLKLFLEYYNLAPYDSLRKQHILELVNDFSVQLGLLEMAEDFVQYTVNPKHNESEIKSLISKRKIAFDVMSQISYIIENGVRNKVAFSDVLENLNSVQNEAYTIFPYSFSVLFGQLSQHIRDSNQINHDLIKRIDQCAFSFYEKLYFYLHLILLVIKKEQFEFLNDLLDVFIIMIKSGQDIVDHMPSYMVAWEYEINYTNVLEILEIGLSKYTRNSSEFNKLNELINMYNNAKSTNKIDIPDKFYDV